MNYYSFKQDCILHNLILTRYASDNFDNFPREIIYVINCLYIESFNDIIIETSPRSTLITTKSDVYIFGIKNYVNNDKSIQKLKIDNIHSISYAINDWCAFTNKEQYQLMNDRNKKYYQLKITERVAKFFTSSETHVFGVLNNTIICAGLNNRGQLGLGHNKPRVKVVQFIHSEITTNNIIKIKCSMLHTLFLTIDSLYGVGWNEHGQLGLSDYIDINIPSKINIQNILNFDSGDMHTLVLTTDGLYGCGYGANGELFKIISNTINILTKIRSSAYWFDDNRMFNIVNVCCGSKYSLMLTNHEAYATGNNVEGQLGLGDNYNHNFIEQVNLSNIISIHCGNDHTIFRTKDGIYACGSNDRGQLGLNLKQIHINKPFKIVTYNPKSNRYTFNVINSYTYEG